MLWQPEFESKSGGEYESSWATLRKADGILVPGGFGERGMEGKILAANYARTSKKPYLGVCLGTRAMQSRCPRLHASPLRPNLPPGQRGRGEPCACFSELPNAQSVQSGLGFCRHAGGGD